MSRPALFLDRDGVINRDHGYVFQIGDFELIDGVMDALRLATERGYALIIITNQSGIGRGYFTQAQYDALEAHIRQLFAAEGVPLTAIYHCPHHPDAGCSCRKPEPGLILQAVREHDIDLARSMMIGDKPSDAESARAAGVGRVELVTPDRKIGDIVRKVMAIRSVTEDSLSPASFRSATPKCEQ
jgi:D-glycero-D-manno-heptose 1,7-bisphosphate phosphatase